MERPLFSSPYRAVGTSIFGLATLMLGGCHVIPEYNGVILEDAVIGKIQPGRTTKEEVLHLLGEPNCTFSFDPTRLYYLGQIRHIQALKVPQVTAVKSCVIALDHQNIVSSIEKSNGPVPLAMASQSTPLPTVYEASWLNKVFGNIGIKLMPPGH